MLGKTFKGAATVRLGGGHVSNHRQLMVRLLLPLNSALLAERRTGAIGRHQQLSIERSAVIQRDADRRFAAGKMLDTCRAM